MAYFLPQRDSIIIKGLAFSPLQIVTLDDEEVVRYQAPEQGWDYDLLKCVDYLSVSPEGWKAYLGKQWISSSEESFHSTLLDISDQD